MTDVTRPELQAVQAAVEAKVDAQLARFETLMERGFDEMRRTMEKRFAEVDIKIEKLQSRLIKWIGALFIAFCTISIAINSLMLHMLYRQPTSTAAPAQQPIIIVVPTPMPAPAR